MDKSEDNLGWAESEEEASEQRTNEHMDWCATENNWNNAIKEERTKNLTDEIKKCLPTIEEPETQAQKVINMIDGRAKHFSRGPHWVENNITYSDLFLLGVEKAKEIIQKNKNEFNPQRASLEKYLKKGVTGAMIDGIRKFQKQNIIENFTKHYKSKIEKARTIFLEKNSRDPSIEELHRDTGTAEAIIESVLNLYAYEPRESLSADEYLEDINQEESPENNLSGIAEECMMLIMQKKLELTDKNGKEPTDEQLACETNIDIEIIRYFNESETDVNDESETDVNNIYDMYGEMNDGTVEATDDDKAKQYKELLKFYNILKKRVPRTDEPISALENIRSKPMFLEALRRCLDEHLVNHEGYLPLKIYILMFKYEGEKNKKDQKAYIIASMSKKKSLPKKTKKSLNASKISREYCGDESKRKDITNEALEKFKKKMRKCITNKVKNMGFNDYDIEGYLESIYRG